MTDYSAAFEYVIRTFQGSDGDATKALYDTLNALGPVGEIATNLFRAKKASDRAKVYRGGIPGKGSYRNMAYDRKQWAMKNLTDILARHAAVCGITWGWGVDKEQRKHNAVLFVDLPTGQVSFHTEGRGAGPDYPGKWDGQRGEGTGRICTWIARVLTEKKAA